MENHIGLKQKDVLDFSGSRNMRRNAHARKKLASLLAADLETQIATAKKKITTKVNSDSNRSLFLFCFGDWKMRHYANARTT